MADINVDISTREFEFISEINTDERLILVYVEDCKVSPLAPCECEDADINLEDLNSAGITDIISLSKKEYLNLNPKESTVLYLITC